MPVAKKPEVKQPTIYFWQFILVHLRFLRNGHLVALVHPPARCSILASCRASYLIIVQRVLLIFSNCECRFLWWGCQSTETDSIMYGNIIANEYISIYFHVWNQGREREGRGVAVALVEVRVLFEKVPFLVPFCPIGGVPDPQFKNVRFSR